MRTPLTVKEWMKGYLGVGATDTDAGFIRGFDTGTSYDHDIQIVMDDIDRFIADPKHPAAIVGNVRCGLFGPDPIPITKGLYNMLVDDNDPRVSFFLYKLVFVTKDAKTYTLLGHKTVHNDGRLDLLTDITTLTVRLFEGEVEGPDVGTPAIGEPHMPEKAFAMGVLHIHALDGLRSGASFDSPGASTFEKWVAVEKFMKFYLKRLWTIFSHEG